MLGKLQFMGERLRSYATWLQMLGLFWIGVHEGAFHWWMLLVAIPAIPVVLWFDMKYVLPKYLEYGTTMNPEWKRMMEKLSVHQIPDEPNRIILQRKEMEGIKQ